jgi:hypothetical protein
MSRISQICPVTDAEAERIIRPGTFADLAEQITATQALTARQVPDPRRISHPSSSRAGRPTSARRRWLIGTPLVTGLAVAVLILAGLVTPGHRAGSARPGNGAASAYPRPPAGADSTGPVAAQALSFITSDGYITVIVRNPFADPSRYRAEFAQHHLNITLELVPVSPSLVGTVVYTGQSEGADITPITAQGKCYTGGGGSACPVGVRVPADFHGQADLVFGRAAKPGELYESSAPATAPGEVMHGMRFQSQMVWQVLAMLRERDVTVPVFNYANHGYARNLSHVPGTWYVYDADPWALRQVILFVGPAKAPPMALPPRPGTPVPSPTG